MRAILTILSILFGYNIYAQVLKKKDPIYVWALAIDSRINNGDKRLPKSIIINNEIYKSLKELQIVSYSKKLDSVLKKVDLNLPSNKNQDGYFKKTRLINAIKILPYLKNKPLIYKEDDWSLEVSQVIFSKKENEAIMAMRTSSKTEILDLVVYYFEFKDGKWILSEELSPFLF